MGNTTVRKCMYWPILSQCLAQSDSLKMYTFLWQSQPGGSPTEERQGKLLYANDELILSTSCAFLGVIPTLTFEETSTAAIATLGGTERVRDKCWLCSMNCLSESGQEPCKRSKTSVWAGHLPLIVCKNIVDLMWNLWQVSPLKFEIEGVVQTWGVWFGWQPLR